MLILLPALAIFSVNYIISIVFIPSPTADSPRISFISPPTEERIFAAAAAATITSSFLRRYKALHSCSVKSLHNPQPFTPPMTKALSIRPKFELSIRPAYEISVRPRYELAVYGPFDFATYFSQGSSADDGAFEAPSGNIFGSLNGQLGIVAAAYSLFLSIMVAFGIFTGGAVEDRSSTSAELSTVIVDIALDKDTGKASMPLLDYIFVEDFTSAPEAEQPLSASVPERTSSESEVLASRFDTPLFVSQPFELAPSGCEAPASHSDTPLFASEPFELATSTFGTTTSALDELPSGLAEIPALPQSPETPHHETPVAPKKSRTLERRRYRRNRAARREAGRAEAKRMREAEEKNVASGSSVVAATGEEDVVVDLRNVSITAVGCVEQDVEENNGPSPSTADTAADEDEQEFKVVRRKCSKPQRATPFESKADEPELHEPVFNTVSLELAPPVVEVPAHKSQEHLRNEVVRSEAEMEMMEAEGETNDAPKPKAIEPASDTITLKLAPFAFEVPTHESEEYLSEPTELPTPAQPAEPSSNIDKPAVRKDRTLERRRYRRNLAARKAAARMEAEREVERERAVTEQDRSDAHAPSVETEGVMSEAEKEMNDAPVPSVETDEDILSTALPCAEQDVEKIPNPILTTVDPLADEDDDGFTVVKRKCRKPRALPPTPAIPSLAERARKPRQGTQKARRPVVHTGPVEAFKVTDLKNTLSTPMPAPLPISTLPWAHSFASVAR